MQSQVHQEQVVLLTKALHELEVIPHSLCLQRLDTSLLEKALIIQSADKLDKTITRTRTALLYKQQKFNLLREESEGYSRLAVLLMEPLDFFLPARKQSLSSYLSNRFDMLNTRPVEVDRWSNIVCAHFTSLIGSFDLDPTRVLDIVLDAMIQNFLDFWYRCFTQGSFCRHLAEVALETQLWPPQSYHRSNLGLQVCKLQQIEQ